MLPMKRVRHHVDRILQLSTVKRRLLALVRTPFFWVITLWGNTCLIGCAVAFHALEGGLNPGVHSFLDSLHWAVGIATTVGGGGINPITAGGKIVSILMMMGGAIFLWSYMALFVGAFVSPELKIIESHHAAPADD